MAETRTIDLKGLEHAEREKLIFPNIERLAVGDSLRLALEFNPVPLVFMLKARGEFETAMEKEGPQEWILRVTRTAVKAGDKEHLKQLLKELKEGEVSQEAKARAREFFQAVDATTLGVVEQELIREGVSHEDIRNSLCDIHLEIMRDSLAQKRIEVSAPHPVHTLMEEHKLAIRTLNDLEAAIERLKGMKSFQDLGEDGGRLKDIAHFLVEMENHHQREEQAIFPYLRKHGIVEPPDIMVLDHVEFKKRKKELYAVTHNAQDYDFETYRQKVRELGEYLTKELESHIFKEDNILYQIALQTLSPEEWDEISRECDRVGYCFFTPGREARKEDLRDKCASLSRRGEP